MRHLKLETPDVSIPVIDLPLPFKVQAPTFASVSEAYAYFTRHQDNYAVPDYADDSDDDLPQFVSPDDVDDFFVNPPQFSEHPEGGEPLSSPENEEGDEEPVDESTDEAEG